MENYERIELNCWRSGGDAAEASGGYVELVSGVVGVGETPGVSEQGHTHLVLSGYNRTLSIFEKKISLSHTHIYILIIKNKV